MFEKKVWISAALLLCLALGGGTVLAQDEDSDEETGNAEYIEVNVSFLPESNTITKKLPAELDLTPINVTSVTPALFSEQDGLVLSDALRNVSSINPQSQNGVHDYFYIRGFDSLNGGLLLTDGVLEPEASFYHLYNVQGVEVLKGPGGFLYGSNPLAGTVNIVRKQALPTDLLAVTASTGSYGANETTLDWNLTAADGEIAFRLNGLWNDSDNYRNATESELKAVNPSFAWRPNERTSLTASAELVDAQYLPDSGIPLVGLDQGMAPEIANVSRRQSYQSPVDFSNQEVNRFQVDFQTEVNESVTLRNKTYFRDLDWRSAGTLIVGTDSLSVPTTTTVLRALSTLDNKQRNLGNQFEALFKIQGDSVDYNILAGLEVSQLTNEFSIGALSPPSPFLPPGTPTMDPIDLFSPMETFAALPGFIPVDTAGNAESTTIAPYVVAQISFIEKFQVLAGVRYDNVDYEDSLNGFKRDDSELSPTVGFTWAPLKTMAVYANAGQAFGPPPTRVSATTDPTQLEPEESNQLELGVRKEFLDGKMRTSFAVYELERKNIGIADFTGVTLEVGDQRSRGFEFELAAEPLPRLRTFVSYAFTDAELTSFSEATFLGPADRSGNTSPFAPEHLLNLWVSKSWQNGFGVGGGARYAGKQFIDEDNVYEIDATLTLDASVSYNYKGWDFRVNLKNLTDEDYEVRGFGPSSVIPAAPFTASATVGFRL